MKSFRDNIYEALKEHCPHVARQWRQAYVSPVAFGTERQELDGVIDYFFNAFSGLQGNFTHELNCIVGNSLHKDRWLTDFNRVIAPSFVRNASRIFAPIRDLDQNVTEFGRLLGA